MFRFLCWFGLHRTVIHELNGDPVSWVTIGNRYKGCCSRCGAETEPFTLTRDMLP